jgi:uncharacterized membrane protein YhdT
MRKENKWAFYLGLIDIAYFVVTYGIGWIPGFTGWIDTDNVVAAVLGVNLILYSFLKK